MYESFKKIDEYHLVIYHSIRAIYESYGSTLPKHLEQQLASVVYSIGEYIDDNPKDSNVISDEYYRRLVLDDTYNNSNN
ncbi:MAG: hypothetical protein ACLUFU_03265 [Bacilli bacterium]